MHEEGYYEKLGFKCGLEIHQRLATKEKLFCSCGTDFASIEHGKRKEIQKISRYMRAVAGELGNVDLAATYEEQKARKFVYTGDEKLVCLVDIDEEPPHELNKEALNTALLMAAALNSKVPNEIEPMRKAVVDGSDPSAFQRTMLIGYDGSLEIDKKNIPITSIFLEEESSGIVSADGSSATYNVDRLGIPLIEIDTDPVIRTPEQAKKVAMQIGLLLRLTQKVQRGIGSIRQDVNVSIREGARVEVKGFQELATMDAIIENEIQRQLNLIEIKKELVKRKAKVAESKEITKILSKTDSKVIKGNMEKDGIVLAARLSGFEGLVGREINPSRRLGSEISDYAKMAGVKGIIHSDENLEGYGLTKEEIESIKRSLDVKKGDAFMFVVGEAEIARRAIALASTRAAMALESIPVETRAVDSKNLTTRFLRPLPGGARMYPETDASPIEIDEKEYKKMLENRLDSEMERKKLEKEIGNVQLADQMLWSSELSTYNRAVKETKIKPSVAASILLEKFTELRRNGLAVDTLSEETIMEIFDKYAKGIVTKVGIEEVLKALPKSPQEVNKIIESKKLKRISGKELLELIHSFGKGEKGNIIREIMSKHRVNVDGEELNNVLSKANT